VSGEAIRVADRDRERVVERLRRAAAEGRLEPEELEERVEAALGSRTDSELVRLTADLPSERRSRRRRQRVAEFHRHRVVFLAVSLGLVVLWALCGFGYFWPMWPLLGWGSGLFFHGRAVRAV
jgi:hypothetical protein